MKPLWYVFGMILIASLLTVLILNFFHDLTYFTT